MKKILGIIVLGLLLSGNAYAKTIILKCTSDMYKDEDGWRSIKGKYDWVVILDTDKEEYRVSNTKDGQEDPLIATEKFFGTYDVANYIYGSANPTIIISYTEVNRYNGKMYFVSTQVPVPVGKKLQKLANGRNKEKAYKAVKDIATKFSRTNLEETNIQTSYCSKTTKAF